MDQRAIETLHAPAHVSGRDERITAARLDAVVETKQRHHAVADELVNAPACRLHGMSHLGKVLIEEEHQVVGEFLFGEPGERPEIGEEDRDLALGAVQIAGTSEPVSGPGGGRQQWRHAQIAVRAELTCEPNIGRRAHALQHLHLLGRGRRNRLVRPRDLDAAGGTASAAAAHGGVRNTGHAACLQHRHAPHDPDHAAARIGQADDAVTTLLPAPTRHPRGQHGQQRCQERVAQPHHHLIDDRDILRGRLRMCYRQLGDPSRILGHRHDLAPPFENAENRQGRQQQCECVEGRLPAFVPRLHAQPEPQSNDGVDPGDHQHRELKSAARRIGHEIYVQRSRVIAVVGAVERVGDPRVQDVIGEDERNRESEDELRRFGGGHPERAAQPQCPQRQAVMCRERAVEDETAERAPPNLVDKVKLAIHDLDRDEAQAVVDEMSRHVGEHDEARSQPEPPDHAFSHCLSSPPVAMSLLRPPRWIKLSFPQRIREVQPHARGHHVCNGGRTSGQCRSWLRPKPGARRESLGVRRVDPLDGLGGAALDGLEAGSSDITVGPEKTFGRCDLRHR